MLIPFPDRKFNIIYADPAWQYANKKTGGSMKSGSAAKYPTMPTKEICAMPIRDIADKDSVLFLWITTPLLPDGFEVMKAWGYKYKTMLTWHKTGRLGLGFWFRGHTEHLLFGVKGKVKAFRLSEENFHETAVLKHSEKPEYFRGLIERATAKIDNPRRIELFARTRVEGWTAWGLEVDKNESKGENQC